MDMSFYSSANPDIDLCWMDQASVLDAINGTLSKDLDVICQNNSVEMFFFTVKYWNIKMFYIFSVPLCKLCVPC